jgi:hypothetical protein
VSSFVELSWRFDVNSTDGAWLIIRKLFHMYGGGRVLCVPTLSNPTLGIAVRVPSSEEDNARAFLASLIAFVTDGKSSGEAERSGQEEPSVDGSEAHRLVGAARGWQDVGGGEEKPVRGEPVSQAVQNCGTCYFGRQAKAMPLYCRRFPPTATGNLPSVHFSHWCGEWRAK